MATIEVTDNKAFRITGILIKGKQYISIRQMYKKKGDKKWQHGKNGVNVELELSKEVRLAIKKISEQDESKFEEISFGKD